MANPKWLKSYISASEHEQIEKAVKTVETKTSGEVVPMVVRRSSTVGHVPLILLFALSLLFFVLDIDYWQTEWIALPHWLLIVFDLIALVVIVRILSPIPWVERMLTPKDDQALQVEQRAINEFYNHRLDHTDQATGILIYVSLMEHRAVVLGDRAISKKIPQEKWQETVDRLIRGVKQKNLAQGFSDAIDLCGEILQENFPIQPNDKNELKNHLIVKE